MSHYPDPTQDYVISLSMPGHRARTSAAPVIGACGKLAMRLRLVGLSASTMKEYHHAESLPA
ncbi:MAG TPA: hypothetical protein VL461_07690 [Dictyobacter sp.]|jgi:hypothetical protein|nr:hypothetical protein [Dictyobacter sp.]